MSSRLIFIQKDICEALAVYFLSLVWIPAMVVSSLLLSGMKPWLTVTPMLSLLALAVLWGMIFGRFSLRNELLIGAFVLGTVLISAALSLFFYDTAGDGICYHAETILSMLKGVNPVYQQLHSVYSEHYPKAAEYFSVVVIHTFGRYQLGKIYNFLLLFAAAAYACSFFLRFGLSGLTNALATAAVAMNPIAAAQLFCYYVDGAIGSLLTMILFAIANIYVQPKRFDRTVFVMASSLAIGTKFTGGPYVVAALCLLIFARLLSLRRKTSAKPSQLLITDALTGVLAVLLGVVVLGYNPYITNVRDGFHLLYPIMGENKIDVMTSNTPSVLLEHPYNRVQKFAISFFSRTFNNLRYVSINFNNHWGMKVPFTVSKGEIINCIYPDVRMGGWGTLFSGITLSAMAIFCLVQGWQRHEAILLELALVLFTTFLNPECWWARYTPQIALLPILLLLPVLSGVSARHKLLPRILCVLLLLNNLVFVAGSGMANYIRAKRMFHKFDRIAMTSGRGEYWAYNVPNNQYQLEQFSGIHGIIICGQIDPPGLRLPPGGFPMTSSYSNTPEVVLYRGACSTPPSSK
jgi:hypothetical protein